MNFLPSFLPSSNPSRMYRGILAFTVIMIVIAWVATIFYLRDERQREIAQVMQANANLARAFEEHTIRTINQIDQLVLLVSAQYQRLGTKLDLVRFAREAGANPELVVIIVVLDERGDAVITNFPAPPANVADRDHFQFHSQHDSGKLFIGKAVIGRLGGRWLMPMSRRINKPDGSFGGAVSVGVDPLYFSKFYRDIDLGKEGVVTLGGRDGFIRSRLSGQEPGAGQDVRNTPIVNAIERSQQGSLMFTSIVDGISRIWSYRALRDYPLYVTVGVSEKEALVTHDHLRRGSYVAAGFVTLLILAFCGWLLRLDIREQKARAALAITEQRQAALLDSIPDNAWFKDGDGRFLAVNRAYARSIGIEPETAIGKTTRDFVPADAAERSTAEDQQVLSSGNPLRIERQLFFGNDLAWYDVIKVPIKDQHGRVIGVVCIARDITERRAAQAEVETLNAKLRVANEALERRVAERTSELETVNSSLRESEAHYRAVAQSANDAIVTADTAGNIVDWNRGAEIIFGYTQAEINGQPLTLLMPYLYRDRHLTDMNRVLSGGEPRLIGTTVELKGLRRDQSEFPLELSLAKWETAEGHFVTGIIRDISERKRAEAEVRTLSRAVEQSPASIVITDQAGNIEYVNPRFEQVTGYTRAEAVGRNPRILKSGMTPAETYRDLWKVISEGSEWRGELCNRRKNGELFWEYAAISGLRDENGKIAHFVAVKEDITERKRAEKALSESEDRLKAVFHSSPVGISVSRVADGRLLEINDAALRIYGYSREEFIGRTAAELGLYVHPEQRTAMMELLRSQGHLDGYEIDIRSRCGAVKRLAVFGRIIELSGEPCFISLRMDITERKHLEEVHLQAQKLESLGTLAGGIAHDFNNILAAIRGNADLAAEEVGPDHVAATSLEEIRKASVRASEVVRRIMAFGRPSEPRQDVVDLSAVAGEVLKLLRSTLPAGISLNRDFAKDTPHVLADAGQIHEVIVNLTTNAAYAIGPRAGSIEYRLEPVQVEEELARSIPGLKPGCYARLTVSDSGCGMDAATLERIFDAFYTTKPVGEGTGLGLSMVHGIMRSNGGVVTVESTPGKGSSFHLYFPAAMDQAVREGESASAQSMLSAGQRVLYVDDEEALVFLAERSLSRLGHSVSGFTDPEAALEAFRAHPQDYDVVVTDLSMPHLSGFELAREVLAARPGMPVLMTTGYIRAEDEGNARAAGIRALVLKPTTMDELGSVLDRLFRGR